MNYLLPDAVWKILLTTLVLLTSSGACANSSHETKMTREFIQDKFPTENKKQGSEDLIIFNGICDGSAAVKLAEEMILVAYDELNTLFAFEMSGGAPTTRTDLAELLDLQTQDEIDIEAATLSDGRIWWSGSYNKDKHGRDVPNRHMLFATNIPSPDLTDIKIVTKPINLLQLLLNSPEVRKVLTNKALLRLPKKGGINIEGLAATTEGGLHVGFRSPLSGANGTAGNALIVTLTPEGETFAMRKVTLLDLDNRGIRDLVNDEDRYIIIAGPVAPGGEFALYSWDGTNDAYQIMNLDDINAESVVNLSDRWLVLSDDGKLKRADNEATKGERICDNIRKKNSKGEAHPNVFFRARTINK